MSLYEYLDILARGYERIDFLRNMFIAVHPAIANALSRGRWEENF